MHLSKKGLYFVLEQCCNPFAYLFEPFNPDIVPLLDGGVAEQTDHLPLLDTEVVAVRVEWGPIRLHRHGGCHHARLVY